MKGTYYLGDSIDDHTSHANILSMKPNLKTALLVISASVITSVLILALSRAVPGAIVFDLTSPSNESSGNICLAEDIVEFGCEVVAPDPQPMPDPDPEPSPTKDQVLVFSKTADFRHESIPAGIQMFQTLAEDNGFEAEFSEDADIFLNDDADKYDAVVFLNTDSNIFNEEQKAAFQNLMESGKGFVGIHGAAATHYKTDPWDWYTQLVGARFKNHPEIQWAYVNKTDLAHPSTNHLPTDWQIFDEWYNFEMVSNNIEVLLTLDESTYEGGEMGDNHPIAWHQEFEGIRSWYTGLGHTEASFESEPYQQHVLGGLIWVLAEN